ncbi:MAG: DUF1289 domain-containing protein [Proteobacteria bacterium]|nr:DUF1289 domain-containing protein [Pseudomonadota bacterium]
MIASPCNKVCVMGAGQRYCLGCQRTLEEITRWSQLSDTERDAVLRQLAARKEEQACAK